MSLSAAAGEVLSTGTEESGSGAKRLYLRLPATSANLGPGFDAIALALTLSLHVEATQADVFSLRATGRNPDVCGELRRNLLIDVYQKTLLHAGVADTPLALRLHNEIPVGMGCGSSAAVRLAGIALANHFGELGWSREAVLNAASRLEGHPDNAAACWLGGLTVATTEGEAVRALSLAPGAAWRILLVMPEKPLATTAARTVLPGSYERRDAVFNIQRSSLLTAAFVAGRADLLKTAMQDRIHQPFRGELCPLLPQLAGLAGAGGVLGVALSGAGPSVLLMVDAESPMDSVRTLVAERLDAESGVELIECGMETNPALVESTVAGIRMVDGV